MKAISLHVSDDAYGELKSLAASTDRPVAELIRAAMAEYLDRARGTGPSVLIIPRHASGRALKRWRRSDLAEEMRSR